jgi:hypothetical protein
MRLSVDSKGGSSCEKFTVLEQSRNCPPSVMRRISELKAEDVKGGDIQAYTEEFQCLSSSPNITGMAT